MDESRNPEQEAPEEYRPRPRWQVWAARIGIVVVLGLFILQCVRMAWGIL